MVNWARACPAVTGPVETLVVSARDRREAGQEGGARQHPLGAVRVQTHLLPLSRSADRLAHVAALTATRPRSCTKAGAPDRAGTSGIHPAARRRGRR